jgi:hypothetical protein
VKTREDYRELIAKVSDTDIARLAAFIDGEGSININQRNKSGRMQTPQLSLNLVITNTHIGFINWLKRTFDGSVYFTTNDPTKHLGKKQIMRWQVNERMAAIILTRCLQYMLIKKEQAELALVFMETKKRPSAYVGRAVSGRLSATRLTDSEVATRVELKAEMSRLNKHGGAALVH